MLRLLVAAFWFGAALSYGGQEAIPDWVKEVSSRALPAYPPEVHTVSLLDEKHITVQPDGSIVRETREAVRILTPEGAHAARAFIPYFKKVTSVREFKAWLITADGSSKTYGKGDVADIGLQEAFELYDDSRAKTIAAQNATPGSTFIWSALVEDHPDIPQEMWSFQGRDPVLDSRLVMTLPAGWEAKAIAFNHEPIQPIIDGSTYTWELKNLEYIKKEHRSPDESSLSPWLGITYYASGNRNAPREWKDIAIRETALDDPQMKTSDELNAEVKKLAASGADSLGQIRAIGRFVQQLKYVEIATNLAHGGGDLPHPAAQVFAKRYGDCKDKANLMRTMLQQIGVKSYMVVAYYGDRNHVHPEWASGWQFNHMILAIKVPDTVVLPAVMNHPVLGKLLIFDATDPYTPLGLLPEEEQGSYGLLLAGEKGGIVQLPEAPADANRTDITVEGTLSSAGALQATLAMKNLAANAWEYRFLKDREQSELDKEMRAWLQENVQQVEAGKMEATDSFDSGEMDLNFEFNAPRYAQLMQGRLLVFRPAIVRPFVGFPLQSEKREHPLELNSESYHKQVHVKLPDSFTVDELPDDAAFTASFGKYSSNCKVSGTDLVFTEDLTVTATTLPADRYKEARDFFGKVAGAERAPLVLMKN